MKQLKSINSYEPSLLDKIDKGELSVNSAYEIVREKYMGGKKKAAAESFELGFKKLLQKHQTKKLRKKRSARDANDLALQLNLNS